MYGSRTSEAFVNGLVGFLDAAWEHKINSNQYKVFCPCTKCENEILWKTRVKIERHLCTKGFMESYTCWTKHVEEAAISMFDDSRDDVTNDDHDRDEPGTDDPRASLEQMIDELEDDADDDDQMRKFIGLSADSKKPLYPNCKPNLSKLSATLSLLKFKAESSLSDVSFTKL